ncbi:MAG: hypothetical protein LBL80_05135 [Ruminococcus sp.]|jgi:hypothetical protein|nr:hypothetical protein [Ruminococcus sp.]
MKKEELIAKAHERGITIDEAQVEKYVKLSDEELDTIAGGAGRTPVFGEMVYDDSFALINNADIAAMICGNWHAANQMPGMKKNCWSCDFYGNYETGQIFCSNTEVNRMVLFARYV